MFEHHPYIAGPRDALSPAEIGFALLESPLIPPPKVGDVPSRVVDALARGLERQPTARWPSMPALLAALAPAPRLRRWPIIVAGLAGAGAATIGALAFATVDHGNPPEAVEPASLQRPSPPSSPADLAPVVTSKAAITHVAHPDPDGSGGTVATIDPPAVREPTTITLRFKVEPPIAAIALDGTRVQGTEIVVVKDAAPHLLRITAAGYREYDAPIAFDENQRLFVQLKRATSPPRDTAPHDDHAKTESTNLIDSDNPYK